MTNNSCIAGKKIVGTRRPQTKDRINQAKKQRFCRHQATTFALTN